MLFQSSGRGYPSDSAKHNFCSDSKSSISEISNDVSFLSDFFEIGENRQKCLTKKPGMRQLNYPNVFSGYNLEFIPSMDNSYRLNIFNEVIVNKRRVFKLAKMYCVKLSYHTVPLSCGWLEKKLSAMFTKDQSFCIAQGSK